MAISATAPPVQWSMLDICVRVLAGLCDRRTPSHTSPTGKRYPCCFSPIPKRKSHTESPESTNEIPPKRLSQRSVRSTFFERDFCCQSISIVAIRRSMRNIGIFTLSKLPIPFSITKTSHSLAKKCENMRGTMMKREISEYTGVDYGLQMRKPRDVRVLQLVVLDGK